MNVACLVAALHSGLIPAPVGGESVMSRMEGAVYSCFQHFSPCSFALRNSIKQHPVSGLQRAEEAVRINTILVVNCLFQWISNIQPKTAK